MVMPSRLKFGVFAAAVALAAALPVTACNALLGVTEATLDPDLDGGTDGGGGGSGSTTSAASTGSVGSSGSGSTGSGGSAGVSCSSYCSTIAKNCTGVNAEYISLDVCLAMCGTFDPGQPGDMTNDSLACRQANAVKAAADPITYCQQAGPLAAGPCATPCSAFCLLDFNLCGAHNAFPYDGGTKDCKTKCEAFPYLISADSTDAGPVGDILFLSGDTLNCRIYHLESAYNPADPNAIALHCPHTAVDSATCN
jgi:hypothetical protein